MATGARTVGEAMLPFNLGAALGAAAFGEAAHLHGQAARAVGDFTAHELQSARQTVEQGAHNVSQAAHSAIQNPAVQAAAVGVVNRVVDTYGRAEAAGRAVEHSYDSAKQTVSHHINAAEQTAKQTYDATKRAVSHGIDAVERAPGEAYSATKHALSHDVDVTKRAVGQAYDIFTHPMQSLEGAVASEISSKMSPAVEATHFQHHATPTAHSPVSSDTASHTPTSGDLNQTRNDPRHPGNPDHGLYSKLKATIPEASEQRLLQFTAACHENKITDKNMNLVHFNQKEGLMVFASGGLIASHAIVDLKQPSPPAAESIQQIQTHDNKQIQLNQQIQTQIHTQNAQGQQGPMPGAPGMGR